MTVGDLIKNLEQFDSEKEVLFSYNSRDYWRTIVADRIDAIEEGHVKWSAYHSKNALIEENNWEDDDQIVVILR